MMGGAMNALNSARAPQNPFGQQQLGNLQQLAMQQPAQQQPSNPPFAQQSKGLMGFGRGNDSTLVHMSPNEVGGLQQLARIAGGSLTTNPQTGLPEAGFLESMLPMIAGVALSATGIGAPVAAGMVAAEEGIRNRDWKKGLMAGLGAYGGAGIGGALGSTGAAANAAGAGAASSGAASGLTELNAGNLSALGHGAATAATGAGMTAAPASLSGNLAEMGGNAAHASNVAMAPSTWNADSYGQSMSNMGKGLGSLQSKEGMAAFGHQVGKAGVMEAAAPAMYSAMNPDPIKTPGEAPTQYWVPGRGYNSLYNPTTHGWNPGQFASSPYGMATGGAVDPNAAAMAKYQAMITPGPAAAAPPPPTAMNNYLAQMAHNNLTYTPPSVAPPVQGQLQPMGMGPRGNTHIPPGTDFFNMDFNNLTSGGGGGGYNPYFPQAYPDHGGRRAGGGLISLMGGGSVNGPGDGVSDSVHAVIDGHQPARLAKGEFVVPARIVSELGNGSSDAGAQRLYAMMHRIEAARKKVQMSGDSDATGNLPA
jgi:hypothetical protein